jgi:hypothetical protein
VAFAAAHADGRPQRALRQKPKLESLNLGTMKIRIDTPNFQPGQPATIFSAVRRKLKVDIEVHTVKMAS